MGCGRGCSSAPVEIYTKEGDADEKRYAHFVLILLAYASPLFAATNELWSHIDDMDGLMDHGVETSFSEQDGDRVLSITQAESSAYAWVAIPAPADGLNLDQANYIDAEITNTGASEVKTMGGRVKLNVPANLRNDEVESMVAWRAQ